MKILIAHAGKTGCTREMAELLASGIPNHEVTLADLNTQAPDPRAFDHVVIGGSIRFNRVRKGLRRYLKTYGEALAAVPHTLFLCCAFSDQFAHYMTVAFPANVRATAADALYFGGDLSLSRQKGIDKFFTRLLRNGIKDGEEDGLVLPCLLPEHVRVLADRLRLAERK